MLPGASAVAGDGPVATKSGAVINYATTGKLRVGKSMLVPLVCSVNCSATSTVVLKGLGFKLRNTVSGQLAAGAQGGGHVIKPNGPLLKALKANTGKFRLVSNVTATDLQTGAQDSISNTFKLKR
jgi:hypothetical protein